MDVYIALEFLKWWETQFLIRMYNSVSLVRDATVIPLIEKLRKYIFACNLQIAMTKAVYHRVDTAENLRLKEVCK